MKPLNHFVKLAKIYSSQYNPLASFIRWNFFANSTRITKARYVKNGWRESSTTDGLNRENNKSIYAKSNINYQVRLYSNSATLLLSLKRKGYDEDDK